jgi:hypothetical protein
MSVAMGLLAFYALAGLCTAFVFVTFGVTRVMPASFTIGARVLIWPGAFALWPYVLYRWFTSGRQR